MAVLGVLLCAASCARAQDRVYWSTFGNSLSFATLDGTVGGTFALAGAEPSAAVRGFVLDSATQRLLWANSKTEQIAFTNLGGRSGGTLELGGVRAFTPFALAIDPVERRLYWSNISNATISFADLDGSGGGPLNTTGAAGAVTETLIFDQPSSRVYWTNENSLATPISFANLDGSGGGNLPVGMVQGAGGLAIDHASNRIYWSTPSSIEYANLDGSGRAVLPTGPVQPTSLAIDHAAGRIYWGESQEKTVAFSQLDGSARGTLDPVGTPAETPRFLMISVAPRATKPPNVRGRIRVRSVLTCMPGSWGPDAPEASLYGAPQRVTAQWTRNGAVLPGATASTLRATKPGTYACRETATNRAGTTTVTSRGHRIRRIRHRHHRRPHRHGRKPHRARATFP